MNSLIIKNLSKYYPSTSTQALSDVSISIRSGEFASILGPSGSGKSTLFNILTGIESQTSGGIYLDGKLLEKRTGLFGYMPQSPSLLPWRNVLENMMLGPQISHLPQEESRKKALLLLKKFGLYKYRTTYPSDLSGGMKQRVSLLRTVLFQKNFLLLDEPFGSLDALTRLSCQNWLLDLYKELSPTIIFITHDIREAIYLSDTIFILNSNKKNQVKKFSVPLPRPRSQNILGSKKALILERKILSSVLEEIK